MGFFASRLLGYAFLATVSLLVTVSPVLADPAPLAGFERVSETDARAKEYREQRLDQIKLDRDTEVEYVVAYWQYAIESAGGDGSQLRSTLRHSSPETILRASEASTIDEINQLLRYN